jgi:hypothetical protein
VRYGIGSVMLLFVALLGIDVHAAAPRADVVPQMVADTAVVSHHAPAMGDCMPCAYCYAGPASTVHGFGGESREHDTAAWTALAKAEPALRRSFASERRGPAPVPARIAYCRWRN